MRYRVYVDGSIGVDDVGEAFALSARIQQGEYLARTGSGEDIGCATLTEDAARIQAKREAREAEAKAYRRGLEDGREAAKGGGL